ncbi:MAG: hypothetical protein V8R81_05410 [Clostridia bacterium]
MNFIERSGWKVLRIVLFGLVIYGIINFKFLLSLKMIGIWLLVRPIPFMSNLLSGNNGWLDSEVAKLEYNIDLLNTMEKDKRMTQNLTQDQRENFEKLFKAMIENADIIIKSDKYNDKLKGKARKMKEKVIEKQKSLK